MFIHLGGDVTVNSKEIIGIFDLDTSTVSKHTRNYLSAAEKNGDVVNVTFELPKSFVVCRDARRPSGQVVYISQLSTATLYKRTDS